MKRLFIALTSIMLLLAVQACKDNKRGKNYNEKTRVDEPAETFMKNAIEGGLTEIKASGVALTNSSNQQVISFAKMMIEDHTKVGDALKKFESKDLVFDKDTVDGPHLQMISDLSKKTGPAFDKAYIQMMVLDHEQAVKLFKDATSNDSGQIQDFAKQTLPTIQMHLNAANKLCASLK